MYCVLYVLIKFFLYISGAPFDYDGARAGPAV